MMMTFFGNCEGCLQIRPVANSQLCSYVGFSNYVSVSECVLYWLLTSVRTSWTLFVSLIQYVKFYSAISLHCFVYRIYCLLKFNSKTWHFSWFVSHSFASVWRVQCFWYWVKLIVYGWKFHHEILFPWSKKFSHFILKWFLKFSFQLKILTWPIDLIWSNKMQEDVTNSFDIISTKLKITEKCIHCFQNVKSKQNLELLKLVWNVFEQFWVKPRKSKQISASALSIELTTKVNPKNCPPIKSWNATQILSVFSTVIFPNLCASQKSAPVP